MRLICSVAALLISTVVVATAEADELFLVSASYGNNVIALCERDGSVIWQFKTGGPKRGHAGHHEIQMLENGNILFHDDWNTVKEMQLDGTIVWSYKSSDVHAFTRLANGNTMIAESGSGRILIVDKGGRIVSATPLGEGGRGRTRQAEVLENGNYLVCAENPGTVWEYEIKTRVYGAIRLKNGNTLICSGSGNSVVEVSPEKTIVWQIKGQVPGTKIELKWTTCLQELPNGHFLIGNCHAGPDSPQIFELDKNRKVVWEFNQYDLVGNGMACWDHISADQAKSVRKSVAALTGK